jgi:hypothetical protein
MRVFIAFRAFKGDLEGLGNGLVEGVLFGVLSADPLALNAIYR